MKIHFSTRFASTLAFAALAAACSGSTTEASPSLGGSDSLGGSTIGQGTQVGGTTNSGTGGQPLGGTTGGSAAQGGAPSGGAPTGATNGGAATGGARTGGASNSGAATGGASSAAGGAGGASNGCAVANPVTGTTQDRTITVGTQARTYRLSVPTDYAAGEALPLIFGLNGVGGDGKGAQSSFKLETNHRAIFVYPDSIFKASSNAVDWDYTSNGYDVAFFDALITELTSNYCIDMGRIFSVGVSAGGIMSNMLGCFRGNLLRAIAPASAEMWNNTCKGDVAVMVFCGAQDTFNPCDDASKGALSETNFWAPHNGCGTQTAPSPVASICNAFQGCAAVDPVLICQHSGGHMWPTGGGDMVWTFFMGL